MLALEKDNVIRMNLQLQTELQKMTNDRNFLLHILDRFRRQEFSFKCYDSDSASELQPAEQTKRLVAQFGLGGGTDFFGNLVR